MLRTGQWRLSINGDLRVRDSLIRVDVLIDTVALQGNYISKALAEKWQLRIVTQIDFWINLFVTITLTFRNL